MTPLKRYLGMKRMVSLSLAILFLASMLAASAGTINFSPDLSGKTGTVRGKIQLEKFGSAPIPRGRVSFTGDAIEVTTIPEWQFDRMTVLYGPVLRAEATIANGRAEIEGIAYFLEGDWLHYLAPSEPRETLLTASGELVGRVVTIANNQVEFLETTGQRQFVPMSSIKQLYSPKACQFRIASPAPGAVPGQPFQTEAYTIALRPTARMFHLAALKSDLRKQGDGDLTTGQLVAIGATINAVQVAQMLPCLIYSLGYNQQQRLSRRRQFENFATPVAPEPLVGVPVNLLPPPF